MLALNARLVTLLGDRTAAPLASSLDLHTVGDLLRHYPRRYHQRGELTGFAELEVGEHATVFAEVVKTTGRQLRANLHKVDVTVRDDAGRTMSMAIFNRRWSEKELRAGRRAFFSGKVETFNRKVQLANPEYQLVDDEQGQLSEDFAGALVPIYPATAKVSTFVLATCVGMALDAVELGDDPIPAELRLRRGYVDLRSALEGIHRPADRASIAAARNRLTWDEAFTLQVLLAQRRAAARQLPGVRREAAPGGLLDAFDAQLPFTLTAGQREIGDLLSKELAKDHPMHRLLQGEVGSGKTLIALRAMLTVVDAGGQAALLAPTEVLAQQHFRSLVALLGPLAQAGELGAPDLATRVALLTGSLGAAARRSALEQAASGAAGLIVGTHALLSDPVAFRDLGLVVVDEQHRFGVEQRDALRAKGGSPPHVLVMTATPIPRTVAMTVYGDLEVSTLRELPRGRAAVKTAVVPVADKPQWIETVWTRIREQVALGRQAFVVCPRIGDEPAAESEGRRPAVAVLDLAPMLGEGPLAGLRLEVLHGRMPSEDKDAAMARVVSGAVDVLVSTTVIEVGVDVPNASVMVVMDAERFGVSQLHQLRGRIGRGEHAGLCLLVSEAEEGSPSRQRLEAVAATSDGFALSRVDLEQRREGDVLGANQSGKRSSLRLLSLLEHEELIREAREEAVDIVERDPALTRHPALRQAVRDVLDTDRADYLEKA